MRQEDKFVRFVRFPLITRVWTTRSRFWMLFCVLAQNKQRLRKYFLQFVQLCVVLYWMVQKSYGLEAEFKQRFWRRSRLRAGRGQNAPSNKLLEPLKKLVHAQRCTTLCHAYSNRYWQLFGMLHESHGICTFNTVCISYRHLQRFFFRRLVDFISNQNNGASTFWQGYNLTALLGSLQTLHASCVMLEILTSNLQMGIWKMIMHVRNLWSSDRNRFAAVSS